jgi:tRNA nucleotidyltransferase (CCA-adding enzyme)
MARLGGGGNPNAGSVLLKSKEFDDIEGLITKLLTEKNRQAVQIGDLMSFPVISVTSDTKMKDVAMILREKGCTGLPVVDEGNLKGVISRRDFHKMRRDSHLETPVRAFMSTKVTTISPENSVLQAARLMVREDIGRLPVVDNERLIGIVTRSDAMRYYYDLLPNEID